MRNSSRTIDKVHSLFLKKHDSFLHIKLKRHTFAPAIRKNAPRFDSLAQQVEHNTFNVGVLGSSPKRITKELFKEAPFLFKRFLKESQGFQIPKKNITNTFFYIFFLSLQKSSVNLHEIMLSI